MEAYIKLSRVTQAVKPKRLTVIICGLTVKSSLLAEDDLHHRYIYAVAQNRLMLETDLRIIQ